MPPAPEHEPAYEPLPEPASDWRPPRTSALRRWRAMISVGLRMMIHDRLKMLGTLFGVVFAVILCVQQLGVMFGLVNRNTMLVDRAGADIWIVPPATESLQGGALLGDSVLVRARATEGVLMAEPLLYGGGSIKLPGGGSEGVTIIGTRWPNLLGGPWNMVAGTPDALTEPDTLIFEDAKREQFGGLNLGSVREVNGNLVRVGGFTWGLIAFAPAYTFAELDTARQLTGIRQGQTHVLVRARSGQDLQAVKRRLAARLPEVQVLTTREFSGRITRNLLGGPIGISFGTSVFFGLAIGFFIVSLLMFSSVLDNLKQFGTLKAIGCTSGDLSRLILAQSVVYALVGSLIGLALILRLGRTISSAQFTILIPRPLVAVVPPVMLIMCVSAAVLALLRIRKLEPGMVFR